jgi:hypothetical protein
VIGDIKHLPAKENMYLALVGGALAAGVSPFDQSFNAHLQSHDDALSAFFAPGKYLGNTPEQIALSLGTYAYGRVFDHDKVSHLGMDLLRAQIVTTALVQPIKYATHRERPDGSDFKSFPSGHAAVTFAGYKLPVPAEVLEAKPGLADYFGKQVILGIRPSDFEDATLGNTSRGMMRVTAGVTEELGSEIMVIFTIDAPHVEHASLAQAAEVSDDEDEAAAALVGGKSLWTARVSKESRVRHGAQLELSVDTRYLQFFDPSSGLSIGHPQASAALAD